MSCNHELYFLIWASDRSMKPGTIDRTGCLAPEGDFWLRGRSRILTGKEKLTLQGFHWSKVPAGFSDAQLSDLAGNMFSAFDVSRLTLGIFVHCPFEWSGHYGSSTLPR